LIYLTFIYIIILLVKKRRFFHLTKILVKSQNR